MVTAFITPTVKSERQAMDIVEIAQKCWNTARLVNLGYLGGYFHETNATIKVESENEREHRAAWHEFVDIMHKNGYTRVF